LPSSSYWRRSIEGCALESVDPVLYTAIKINQRTRVATAGSCFAQRLGRELARLQFNVLCTEPAPPEDADNPFYGLFSAAYGNIYTTIQLRQLLSRAYGIFKPRVQTWRTESGRFLDPFRPGLREDGFSSPEEVLALQQRHFASVRQLFEQADVLIYTLGLTEAWLGPDGEAIPVVPGAVNAEAHGDQYCYSNPSVEVMRRELEKFLFDLRLINPRISVILTVSPVAMIATYEPRHVLVSNTYSKAALRVIAEEICCLHDFVHYFPSYEMVVSPGARGAYYADDSRTVSEAGVRHVMSIFARHFLEEHPSSADSDTSDLRAIDRDKIPIAPAVAPKTHTAVDRAKIEAYLRSEYKSAAAVMCDEERLDRP
jgi:hypothetical protein